MNDNRVCHIHARILRRGSLHNARIQKDPKTAEEAEDCHDERREIEHLLEDRFDLHHTTLQVDHATPEVIKLSKKEDPDEGLDHSP